MTTIKTDTEQFMSTSVMVKGMANGIMRIWQYNEGINYIARKSILAHWMVLCEDDNIKGGNISRVDCIYKV